jgi:hypothetical protein
MLLWHLGSYYLTKIRKLKLNIPIFDIEIIIPPNWERYNCIVFIMVGSVYPLESMSVTMSRRYMG